jgi:DNA-binding protein HU-beta
MNATQLSEKVALTTKGTKSNAKFYIDTITDEIKEQLATSGGEVVIKGFGSFKATIRKERVGRNPSTGETMVIPEKTVVKFKPYF